MLELYNSKIHFPQNLQQALLDGTTGKAEAKQVLDKAVKDVAAVLSSMIEGKKNQEQLNKLNYVIDNLFNEYYLPETLSFLGKYQKNILLQWENWLKEELRQDILEAGMCHVIKLPIKSSYKIYIDAYQRIRGFNVNSCEKEHLEQFFNDCATLFSYEAPIALHKYALDVLFSIPIKYMQDILCNFYAANIQSEATPILLKGYARIGIDSLFNLQSPDIEYNRVRNLTYVMDLFFVNPSVLSRADNPVVSVFSRLSSLFSGNNNTQSYELLKTEFFKENKGIFLAAWSKFFDEEQAEDSLNLVIRLVERNNIILPDIIKKHIQLYQKIKAGKEELTYEEFVSLFDVTCPRAFRKIAAEKFDFNQDFEPLQMTYCQALIDYAATEADADADAEADAKAKAAKAEAAQATTEKLNYYLTIAKNIISNIPKRVIDEIQKEQLYHIMGLFFDRVHPQCETLDPFNEGRQQLKEAWQALLNQELSEVAMKVVDNFLTKPYYYDKFIDVDHYRLLSDALLGSYREEYKRLIYSLENSEDDKRLIYSLENSEDDNNNSTAPAQGIVSFLKPEAPVAYKKRIEQELSRLTNDISKLIKDISSGEEVEAITARSSSNSETKHSTLISYWFSFFKKLADLNVHSEHYVRLEREINAKKALLSSVVCTEIKSESQKSNNNNSFLPDPEKISLLEGVEKNKNLISILNEIMVTELDKPLPLDENELSLKIKLSIIVLRAQIKRAIEASELLQENTEERKLLKFIEHLEKYSYNWDSSFAKNCKSLLEACKNDDEESRREPSMAEEKAERLSKRLQMFDCIFNQFIAFLALINQIKELSKPMQEGEVPMPVINETLSDSNKENVREKNNFADECLHKLQGVGGRITDKFGKLLEDNRFFGHLLQGFTRQYGDSPEKMKAKFNFLLYRKRIIEWAGLKDIDQPSTFKDSSQLRDLRKRREILSSFLPVVEKFAELDKFIMDEKNILDCKTTVRACIKDLKEEVKVGNNISDDVIIKQLQILVDINSICTALIHHEDNQQHSQIQQELVRKLLKYFNFFQDFSKEVASPRNKNLKFFYKDSLDIIWFHLENGNFFDVLDEEALLSIYQALPEQLSYRPMNDTLARQEVRYKKQFLVAIINWMTNAEDDQVKKGEELLKTIADYHLSEWFWLQLATTLSPYVKEKAPVHQEQFLATAPFFVIKRVSNTVTDILATLHNTINNALTKYDTFTFNQVIDQGLETLRNSKKPEDGWVKWSVKWSVKLMPKLPVRGGDLEKYVNHYWENKFKEAVTVLESAQSIYLRFEFMYNIVKNCKAAAGIQELSDALGQLKKVEEKQPIIFNEQLKLTKYLMNKFTLELDNIRLEVEKVKVSKQSPEENKKSLTKIKKMLDALLEGTFCKYTQDEKGVEILNLNIKTEGLHFTAQYLFQFELKNIIQTLRGKLENHYEKPVKSASNSSLSELERSSSSQSLPSLTDSESTDSLSSSSDSVSNQPLPDINVSGSEPSSTLIEARKLIAQLTAIEKELAFVEPQYLHNTFLRYEFSRVNSLLIEQQEDWKALAQTEQLPTLSAADKVIEMIKRLAKVNDDFLRNYQNLPTQVWPELTSEAQNEINEKNKAFVNALWKDVDTRMLRALIGLLPTLYGWYSHLKWATSDEWIYGADMQKGKMPPQVVEFNEAFCFLSGAVSLKSEEQDQDRFINKFYTTKVVTDVHLATLVQPVTLGEMLVAPDSPTPLVNDFRQQQAKRAASFVRKPATTRSDNNNEDRPMSQGDSRVNRLPCGTMR